MSLFRFRAVASLFRCDHYRYLTTSLKPHPDYDYVNLSNAPSHYDHSAVVYPGFLSEEEGQEIVKEVSKRMKRRRFEDGHWDSVISKYREIELATPNEVASLSGNTTDIPQYVNTIERTRDLLKTYVSPQLTNQITWLPCHAIDLSKDGRLDAHVDSVKFSGGIVAGISLLSDSIMRLRPAKGEWLDDTTDENSDGHYVDLYLPKLSLYCLHGMSRFHYSHELLPSDSVYQLHGKNVHVARGRRLSIIFRDALVASRD
jgi:alkylated DNA repair protein alkB family protein 7